MTSHNYPEIKYEDIRKGDTIHCEYEWKGMTGTMQGIAARKVLGTWLNERDAEITVVRQPELTAQYYLVDRPKQQLPTKPGSVLLEATLEDGVEAGLMFLTGHKKWCYVGGSADPERITSFTIGKVVETAS